ncbi:MAG: hypothetical protein Q9175_000551 [Cornicularia normoerica]
MSSSTQHHPDTPAFTALLDAHVRWQDFEQMSALGTLSLSNVAEHDEPARLSIPTSAALAFIMSYPYIDIADLAEDERICPICKDPYHHLSDRTKDRKVKVAQRMPCGHYLCDHCICKWLSPFEQSNNNTCPFDRRVLFPKLLDFLNTEGMQGRADLIDWLNGARGRHPEGAERDPTGGLKVRLVEGRIGEAFEELEVDRFNADTLLQSKISAREIDAAVLSAYHRELLQFEHRLTTIEAVANSIEGHMQVFTLQARLQRMAEGLARDRGNVQEIWDALKGLGEGKVAEGSEESR